MQGEKKIHLFWRSIFKASGCTLKTENMKRDLDNSARNQIRARSSFLFIIWQNMHWKMLTFLRQK